MNDAAERLYLAAIAAAENHYGTGVVEVARLLNDLAVVYKYAARFDEPKRALGVVEAARAADHIDTATIWHNLGGVEHARGRFVDGEIYARRSVQIRETVLGQDHVAVAADLAALAALVQEQRRCDEAEKPRRRREASGSDRQTVAHSWVSNSFLRAPFFSSGFVQMVDAGGVASWRCQREK